MLDGQCKTVVVAAYVRISHDGLPWNRLEEDLLLNRPPCAPGDPMDRGSELDRMSNVLAKETIATADGSVLLDCEKQQSIGT